MSLFPRRKKFAESVAILLPDGRLDVRGSVYSSPSEAAKQIAGQASNGRNKESRERWKDKWVFCYHLWPTIDGQRLYFEARLDDRDRHDQVIRIVRIHRP